MNSLQKAGLILRNLGPAWVLFRLRYAAERRSGALKRRTPIGEWPTPIDSNHGIAVPIFRAPAVIGSQSVTEADAILAGRFRLFSIHEVSAGFPPVWNRNPLTGETAPVDRHWSELGDFAFGDIKAIWELNRMPWAFSLARAWARTGAPRYAEGFWALFEDWMRRNPPNVGPAWMCGQEATFRLMAATFARQACAAAPSTTPVRVARFDQFVAATGHRIAANLDYALSQSNNHGVSECVGLLTAALLAPHLPEAAAWRRRSLSHLECQLEELVYEDGTFAQHSAVYHRVLLHDLLWAATLMRAHELSVPTWLLAAGRRALEFLLAMVSPLTGRVPLYGANDGSNILLLADADYLDFRPVVQAGCAVFNGERRVPEGPWDEAADWLAGSSWRQATIEEKRRNIEARHFPDGGVVTWRRGDLSLFFRCPARFQHRPSQADLLHVSLEQQGYPVVLDAGTFSYNFPGKFSGALKEAFVHNTVTFDGREPMERAGRFLYLPWPSGRVWKDDFLKTFTATHDGWAKLNVRHTRTIAPHGSEGFVVEDLLESEACVRARLHWLLADGEHKLDMAARALCLNTSSGGLQLAWQMPENARVTLVRADPDTNRGWWSPYYGYAAPALSLAIEFELTGKSRLATTFHPLG